MPILWAALVFVGFRVYPALVEGHAGKTLMALALLPGFLLFLGIPAYLLGFVFGKPGNLGSTRSPFDYPETPAVGESDANDSKQ